ncbi:MAG: 3-hydroxyacyl-CoA dehydrogenase NAD-binding domain-containing protein [Steroidobacteraceae bacterium]|jgi:3-hydroxybutyryl-CoA dehydrogenase/5-formyl-3-hydroxy-2-methylpyridine 4-carboxylate dehydrogenase
MLAGSKFKNAAVIGLGTMGPGIAATLARAGMAVSAFDADPAKCLKAGPAFAAAATVLSALAVPDHSAVAIKVHDTLAACVAGAELVIETVPEDLDLKIRVFRDLEAQVGEDCILASDTSGIPITRIQAGTRIPGRVIGMHWSNPPHIIPMIEVISGAQTSPEVAAALVELIRRCGHLPITIRKDVPGFVENRVLYAVMRECLDLVEQGVIEPQDLDSCVSWGIGYKLAVVGPMALLDMAGLDIYAAVAGYLNQELSNRPDVASYIKERTAQHKLGIKTGSGIYSYTPERIAELQSARAAKLVAVRKALQA